MMMKNTIAKLLAEEDIFVVRKQMETAYFDVKNRELGLPIWKENTMTDVEEELLICHEIGHALWTPLDMMEKTQLREIEHSVVNVLEDARIEKKVMNKYLGTVRIFKNGYESLIKKDFFGTSGKDLSKHNLIDRINLHYKNNVGVPFSEDELVWVEKAGKTVTSDDVLDLAEELIAWMKENPESMGDPDESGDTSGESMGDPIDGSGESGSGESGDIAKELADAIENGSPEELSEKLEKFIDEMEKGENGSKSDDGDNGDVDGDSSDGENSDGSETGDGEELKVPETSDVIEGGKDGSGGAAAMPNITAETADKFGKSLQNARDLDAESYTYVRINDLDLNKIIVPYKTVVSDLEGHYKKTDRYFTSTLEEINEKKKSAKKTVAYMVKEFEMKKSADAYARAAVSKTGSLDMGKLHTYKYNEDLFRKVTTLPGATNHGLVMCLDWSGSMANNLKDTLTQLFNLVWFCRRTKIPFEVYAFSNQYTKYNDVKFEREAGAFHLDSFAMLNFFSSKMTVDEEMKMMHYLWMIANQWGYRDWREYGYPTRTKTGYCLGGTPLNEAIIAMMKIVPKFKNDNNLQKVHSVFLTDGAGSALNGKNEWTLITDKMDEKYGEHYLGRTSLRGKTVITDPVTNETLSSKDRYGFDMTPTLLGFLKKRVPDMNVVGFFVAGSGKSGKVKPDTLRYAVDGWRYEYNGSEKIQDALKELKKNNVFVAKSKGYDEYYILPGSMKTEEYEMSDELVGASKAKLKTAFGKSTAGRVSSRPLLNKFISMVA
jgi:hypothetical protein